jgi:hypothetical protein
MPALRSFKLQTFIPADKIYRFIPVVERLVPQPHMRWSRVNVDVTGDLELGRIAENASPPLVIAINSSALNADGI